MARLHVAMTGLMCLVERRTAPNEPAVVLLRRVDQELIIAGEKIFPHSPQVVFRSNGIRKEFVLDGQDVDLAFGPRGARRSVEIVNSGSFVPVGKDLKAPLAIHPGLIAPSVDKAKRHLLSGRVFLSGGSVEPVQIDDIRDFKFISSSLNIDLEGGFTLDGANKLAPESRRVANGLVFSADVAPVDGKIVLRIGGETVECDPLGRFSDLRDQFFVWILNLPQDVPNEMRKYDPDFHLLYDLLAEDVLRFVPIVDRRPSLDTGSGHPPGECVKGYAFA